MLKKLAKRITKEVHQAQDYVEQAFIVKSSAPTIADLFIELAKDNIRHAEKMFDIGKEHAEKHTDAQHKEIWQWEYRLMMEDIVEVKNKIMHFRSA